MCKKNNNHVSAFLSGKTGLSLVLLVLLLFPISVSAKAKLNLYPADGGPRAGGHVVDVNEFTLVIENNGTGQGDNIATELQLLISVNDPALLTSLSMGDLGDLASGDFAMGTPVFGCSSKSVPRHSVYPSDFASVSLEDLGPGESISIDITVEGEDGLEVHFDAMATGYEVKRNGTKCYDVFNPSGHDVTLALNSAQESECSNLKIEKTGSVSGADIGETVEYQIEIENSGSCDLNNVVLTDTLPTVSDPDTGDDVAVLDIADIDPAPASQSATELVWNVGALAPGDVFVVTYTGTVNDQMAEQGEVVNEVCASADELAESICDSYTVVVGGVTRVGHMGGPGYWCNRIRAALLDRPSVTFTVEELETLLEQINELSFVFSELEDASTLELTQVILCRPNLAEGAVDKLMRHLMTLWFNGVYQEGLFDSTLDELCPGDQVLPEGVDGAMTVAELIEAAENDIINGAEDDILLMWKDAIEYVNESRMPGVNGCDTETNVVRETATRGRVHTRSGRGK